MQRQHTAKAVCVSMEAVWKRYGSGVWQRSGGGDSPGSFCRCIARQRSKLVAETGLQPELSILRIALTCVAQTMSYYLTARPLL